GPPRRADHVVRRRGAELQTESERRRHVEVTSMGGTPGACDVAIFADVAGARHLPGGPGWRHSTVIVVATRLGPGSRVEQTTPAAGDRTDTNVPAPGGTTTTSSTPRGASTASGSSAIWATTSSIVSSPVRWATAATHAGSTLSKVNTMRPP